MCKNDNKRYHQDIEQINCKADWLKFVNEIGEENKPTTHTVAIDWLTFSFLKFLPDPKKIQEMTITNGKYEINPECYLVHLDSSLNGFKNACLLFIYNRYVGKLLYNPISELPADTVHLIIDNSLFYENNFLIFVAYLTAGLNFRFHHLVRLDIANDYIQHYIYEFYIKLDGSPNIRLKGKAEITEKKRTNRKLKYLIVGSPNSDKRITIYSKSKESENNLKQYIIDHWTANGLDYINNNVERVELRLSTAELKNIDYRQLDKPEYLLSICKLHFKNFFEFTRRFKQNGKYINRDVTPININFTDYNTIYLTRSICVPSDNIIIAKGMLHKLYNSQLTEQMIQDNETDLTLVNPEHLDNNKLMIERHLVLYPQLVPYFERKKTTWENEYRQKNIMCYTNTEKMIQDSIRIIEPVIEPIEPICYFDLNLPSIMDCNIIDDIEPVTTIEAIDLKYQNIINIQYIKDMYIEFINKDSNNSKLSINDYIQLVIYIASDYSTKISYSELNNILANYNLFYYNNTTDSIFQKLISKEYNINKFNTELVA